MFSFSVNRILIDGFDVIDLSNPIVPEKRVPGGVSYSDPRTYIHKVTVGDWTNPDITSYMVSKIVMGAHAGTHIDAGMHTSGKESESIDKINANLVGNCIIVDITETVNSDDISKMLVGANDKSIIVVRGKANCGAMTNNFREQIAIKKPLAVVFGQCVNVVGVDDTKFFCGRNIPMIMDAANLDKLKNGDIIFALPVLINGIEASPVRLFAIRFKESAQESKVFLPPIEED